MKEILEDISDREISGRSEKDILENYYKIFLEEMSEPAVCGMLDGSQEKKSTYQNAFSLGGAAHNSVFSPC